MFFTLKWSRAGKDGCLLGDDESEATSVGTGMMVDAVQLTKYEEMKNTCGSPPPSPCAYDLHVFGIINILPLLPINDYLVRLFSSGFSV